MNEQTIIDGYLDELSEMVEKGWTLPFSGGKVFVDADELRQLVNVIREYIPEEIKKSKEVLADRDQIIEKAKKDAEIMMKMAEDKARAMLNQDEIVRQAQVKANEMILQGQAKCRELRKASSEYVDDIMRRADASVSQTLVEIRKTRQNIQATQKTAE